MLRGACPVIEGFVVVKKILGPADIWETVWTPVFCCCGFRISKGAICLRSLVEAPFDIQIFESDMYYLWIKGNNVIIAIVVMNMGCAQGVRA